MGGARIGQAMRSHPANWHGRRGGGGGQGVLRRTLLCLPGRNHYFTARTAVGVRMLTGYKIEFEHLLFAVVILLTEHVNAGYLGHIGGNYDAS